MQRSPYPGEELQTTHSFILPLPFTPSTRRRRLRAPSRRNPSLFPPIIESNAEEEAKLQNIKNNGIWQNASSSLCQREMG